MASQSRIREYTPPSVDSDFSYQSDFLEDASLAVLQELGANIPMICHGYETFLARLTPRPPDFFDLDATMKSLGSGSNSALKSSNGSDRWRAFPKAPKDYKGSEGKVFRSMEDIFKKVVAAIAANSGRQVGNTIEFKQNLNWVPISADRDDKSRPDGYLVLKTRETNRKNEQIHWGDIALSCEYKEEDGVGDFSDVRTHQGFLISHPSLTSHLRTCESACGVYSKS